MSTTPSSAAPQSSNQGGDNPFNLGDSGVFDLDSMLGSGSDSGSKNDNGNFSSLDDFDINNFKF